MAKILIAAHIDVDPAQREQCLKTGKPFIEVFEEWTSEEALAQHFKNVHYTSMRDHIGKFGLTNAVSAKYRVDAEGPVYNAEGQPTPSFD